MIEAKLPRIYHHRIEDNLLNRTLLSGLHTALSLTSDLWLRTHIRKTIQMLSQSVTMASIDSRILVKASTHINRMTSAYGPALTILQILIESQGASIEKDPYKISLPGFLFDMNRFFQGLINRF